ncbi:MAG TPA: LamG domain-containing protein [Bacillota bacterium]|nr:LamG domain-containing protein [Bacillota bacterium]
METHLKHHWKFEESRGSIALDTSGKVDGILSSKVIRCQEDYGVHIDGSDDSYIIFSDGVGQFGANDFTVVLWLKTSEKYRYFDVIGNRTAGSHGNFFSIRMTGKHESWPEGMIVAEVDQDGQNYIELHSEKTGLNDENWHHIAVTRQGGSLKLYVDGTLSGQGTASGPVNIANGNPFKLGRSLQGVSDRFAPNAHYWDLRIYDIPLNESEVSSLSNCAWPDHQWKFDENSGPGADDFVGGVKGTLSPTVIRDAQGSRDVMSVQIDGSDDSFITFGDKVGQFGTSDFTVALWLQTSEKYRYFDLIGNRTAGSHGNFFCIRMTGKHESSPEGMIVAEVDQDGQNYIDLNSSKTGLNDGQWHHVAVTRQGVNLKLYVDGELSARKSASGIANIANGNPFKLGRSLQGVHDRFTPDARYGDLRVYKVALTDEQVWSLCY